MTDRKDSNEAYRVGDVLVHHAYSGQRVSLVEKLSDGRWLVDRGDRKTRVSEKTLSREYALVDGVQ